MLTKRQKEVLDYITKYSEVNGFGPTLNEISNEFGMGSSSAAHQHVEALRTKGFLKKLPYQTRSISVFEKSPDAQEIPLLGRIALGRPIESFTEPDSIKVPLYLLSGSGPHYALEAFGDSMNADGILDSDILVIQQTNQVNNGDCVVAVVPGYAATLKRFYDHGNKIELRPKSTNIEHKPQFYSQGEVEIQGKFCGLIRKN